MIEMRKVTDVDTLLEWRKEVIRAVFEMEPSSTLIDANRRFYEIHIPDNSHLAIVSSIDGEDCGCAAVCFSDEMPSPDNPSGKCAYLMNIYVRESYRMRGVAHAMLHRLIEEALTRGSGKIFLETTDDGRPVYESIGFKDMDNMMKYMFPPLVS